MTLRVVKKAPIGSFQAEDFVFSLKNRKAIHFFKGAALLSSIPFRWAIAVP